EITPHSQIVAAGRDREQGVGQLVSPAMSAEGELRAGQLVDDLSGDLRLGVRKRIRISGRLGYLGHGCLDGGESVGAAACALDPGIPGAGFADGGWLHVLDTDI